MSVRRESDADGAAKLADELDAAGARTLSGYQMRCVREAIRASTRALSRINTKGLVMAHRRDVEAAQEALRLAAPMVVEHAHEIAAS